MKAKLKSANGFTRFMLAHGEKLGMAAVVVVAALLIWIVGGWRSRTRQAQNEPKTPRAPDARRLRGLPQGNQDERAFW